MAPQRSFVFLAALALLLLAAPHPTEQKKLCRDLLTSEDGLQNSDGLDDDKDTFNSALTEFLCDDAISNDEDDDEEDLHEEAEEHSREKRSPFWGGGGSSSRSSSRGSRSSSSGRRGGGFWGGGRRTSTSSRTSSTKRSGSFWGSSSRTKPKAKTPTKPKSSVWDSVHTSLDVAGLAPGVGVVPDAINTGLHAIRGNWKEAGLSAAAMVPGAGQAVTGTKLAAKAAAKIDRISSASSVTRSFAKKKGTETVKQSSATSKELRSAFEAATGKKHVEGRVSVGKTADGRTLTFRDKSRTGPATLDINKNGDITKIRCKDC